MFRRISITDLLFSVGVRRVLTGWLGGFVGVAAALIAVWVVYAAVYAVIDPWELAAVFLCGMYGLVFLIVGPGPRSVSDRPGILDWVLSLMSLAAGAHFLFNAHMLVSRVPLLDPLSEWNFLFGTILLVATLEAVRRTTGMGLMLIVLLFMAYIFFGHHLSGPLWHGAIPYDHFLELAVFTTDGILGVPVRVAATYAFLFVMFGTFLARAGGSEFFFNLAAVISGRQPGGPAKIAVVSSGLYGMLSGSPTSDVVTTGAVTIPIMRRMGYPSALAGAFEVAASAGGSILPPVMGSAAFIMAEYTGIEYRDIVVAAVIPALLYYISVYAQVHLRSLKLGLRGMPPDEVPKLRPVLREGGLFVVPLLALVLALLLGFSPNMVATFGVLSVVAVAALRKNTRLGLIAIYRSLVETSIRMVPVTGACAAAGLVIAGITMTGVSMKFGGLVTSISGGDLFLALMLAASITIFLGMGMPTPSAYILAAALMGGFLTTDLNVPMLAAHMFLLYYAVMSAITPPVAVAAYAAAPLTDANPLHIAVLAVRLALGAFVIPFAFAYNPAILMIGSVFDVVFAFVSVAAGLIMLAIAVEGYLTSTIAWWARLGTAFAGVLFVIPTIPTTIGGAAMIVVVMTVHLIVVNVLNRPDLTQPSPKDGSGLEKPKN